MNPSHDPAYIVKKYFGAIDVYPSAREVDPDYYGCLAYVDEPTRQKCFDLPHGCFEPVCEYIEYSLNEMGIKFDKD